MKTKIIIILTILVAALGVVAWFGLRKPAEERTYTTDPARISEIKQMVALSTFEFHEEMPIRDSINGKWLVAKATVEGSVKFDMEKVRFEQRGDTTFVTLPEPTVEILESTEPDSYRILDTWDANRAVFGRTLSAAEENAVKRRWSEKVRRHVAEAGYESRARENAIATLTPLFNAMQGTVIVR